MAHLYKSRRAQAGTMLLHVRRPSQHLQHACVVGVSRGAGDSTPDTPVQSSGHQPREHTPVDASTPQSAVVHALS